MAKIHYEHCVERWCLGLKFTTNGVNKFQCCVFQNEAYYIAYEIWLLNMARISTSNAVPTMQHRRDGRGYPCSHPHKSQQSTPPQKTIPRTLNSQKK